MYDIKDKKFPVAHDEDVDEQPPLFTTDSIDAWIEIGQISYNKDLPLYIHSDPVSQENKQVKDKVRY